MHCLSRVWSLLEGLANSAFALHCTLFSPPQEANNVGRKVDEDGKDMSWNEDYDSDDERVEAMETVQEEEYHIHVRDSPFYCHPEILTLLMKTSPKMKPNDVKHGHQVGSTISNGTPKMTKEESPKV
ncbi:unnamed protein product [Caenorhabditis brenneri]